ncbi:CDP-glycerol glycerophosphotransferase family protein [Virgibacillus sp. MSP4-1]|uniref:CDP-glycerol glycerophosphotransferase family protein n=1 Tax=Virgibacillus sp. MSP4-1 TaxID=2700081 RepID=UPI00039B160D|nr:CDP-glycerol glycerophosphotransferase family protein [Virgibacillus sp. MSP4-1]
MLKLFPQRDKTTFVASFGDNVHYVAKELQKYNYGQLVILQESNCRTDFTELSNNNTVILDFETFNLVHFIKGIYHLATSKVVFVDNYFGFLSAVDFKENVTCVQLWHAAGAIKQFGLKDPSIHSRSDLAVKRFKKVYQRFHYVVVGSEKMASIFRKSFGLGNENILRTGVPRTDFFFETEKHKLIIQGLEQQYPILKNKKVLLYAPTFRDGKLNSFELALNLEKLYQELKSEYVILLRLHPAIKSRFNNAYSDFVIDVSSYEKLHDLLLVTDYVITDYSSIPFEFSLLGKPMIFFTYDLEDYKSLRGFYADYEANLPGPMVKTTEEIIRLIQNNDFDLDLIEEFASQWNEYSQGHSSETLIKTIYQKQVQLDEAIKRKRPSY